MVSIGHTDIKLERLHEAFSLGIGLITHIFNAMGESFVIEKGIKPAGIQEELLICDDLMCEVMCDKKAVHVSPALLKVLLRCKGVNNIILITDSMNMTGNPPGKYYFHDGRAAFIFEDDDVVRLGNGSLAGSIMTINNTILNMIKHTGIGLKEALQMVTSNPAKALKISNLKGEIREGMDADIVVFNNEIMIFMTIAEGKIVYNIL